MKIKLRNFTKIAPLAAAFTLPFAVMSCGEKEKEEAETKKEENAPEKPAAKGSGDAPEKGAGGAGAEPANVPVEKGHIAIGTEVTDLMSGFMEQMSSISDLPSAQKFVADFGAKKTKLQGLLTAAKSLDPPSADELSTVQKMNADFRAQKDELGKKFQENVGDGPQAQVIMGVLGKVFKDQEWNGLTKSLKDLYQISE